MIYITIKNYRLYNSSLQRYVFKILKKMRKMQEGDLELMRSALSLCPLILGIDVPQVHDLL